MRARINFTLKELVELLRINPWEYSSVATNAFLSPYPHYERTPYTPLSFLCGYYYYYYYRYDTTSSSYNYYYYCPKAYLFTEEDTHDYINTIVCHLEHPDVAKLKRSPAFSFVAGSGTTSYADISSNPISENDISDKYVATIWKMIQEKFNDFNCLNVLNTEYNSKLKRHVLFGDYINSVTINILEQYPQNYYGVAKSLVTFSLNSFDEEELGPCLRFLDEASDFFLQIDSVINKTYDRYTTLLKVYEEEQDSLLAQLKTSRTIKNEGENENRLNDTPQVQDDGTIEGDDYLTQYQKGNSKQKQKEVSSFDPMTAMARLTEIGNQYRQIWGDWLDEFSILFYPKNQDEELFEEYGDTEDD